MAQEQKQSVPKNSGTDHFRDIVIGQTDRAMIAMDKLNELAKEYCQMKTSIEVLRKQLIDTRLAYKKIEGIAAYYYPKHIEYYINGAPLNHIDPLPIGDTSQKNGYYVVLPAEYRKSAPLDKLESGHFLEGAGQIIPPEGLQALDKLIFSKEAENNRDEVQVLCQKLKTSFEIVQEALEYRKYYYEYEVIEAVRLELVRVLSRGITGFDTPGSLNALSEASSALLGIEQIVEPFLERVGKKQKQTVTDLFSSAHFYLTEHSEFETFDRLTFIREFLNPLYDGLLQMQIHLGLKSTAEIHNRTPSWNAYARNVFDPDFLNPYYYSMLKERDDNPLLRELGKKLFFDTRLSKGNNLSCASCHKPELAYSDGRTVSIAGSSYGVGKRNVPTLINAVFSDRFFYDLRAFDLEDQIGHVVKNHLEFNTDYGEISAKLNRDTTYLEGFDSVFGNRTVTRHKITSALASFVISLRSFDSAFDKYMRGETKSIDKKVKYGFNLFMGKANCATCHYAPTFSGLVPPLYVENESEVLGVLKAPNVPQVDGDLGRAGNGAYNEDQDIYDQAFKTTTVRNIGMTAPYFHNGAYKTLDEVIDFYNKGGAEGMGLPLKLANQTLDPTPLDLNTSEIEAIKAFLNALTDVPKN